MCPKTACEAAAFDVLEDGGADARRRGRRRASSAPRYASRTTIRLRGTTPSRASATARQPPRSAPSTRTRSGSQVRAARAAERGGADLADDDEAVAVRGARRAHRKRPRWSLTMSRRRTDSGRGWNMLQGSPRAPGSDPRTVPKPGPFGPATGRDLRTTLRHVVDVAGDARRPPLSRPAAARPSAPPRARPYRGATVRGPRAVRPPAPRLQVVRPARLRRELVAEVRVGDRDERLGALADRLARGAPRRPTR